MNELICHLIGDFCLQNHYIALNKAKSSKVCLLHVILYTIPFLFVTRNWIALSIICGTHFIIDRWSIGRMWPAFWGVGEEGKILGTIRIWCDMPPTMTPAPPHMLDWLRIVNDNTLHLLINHLALTYIAFA